MFLLSLTFLAVTAFGNAASLDGEHNIQKRQTAACSLNLETDLPLNQPLLLKPGVASNDLYSFHMPDKLGNINLVATEPVRVVCAGKSNAITKLGVAESNTTCASGKNLTAGGVSRPIQDFNCTNYVTHSAKKNTAEQCEIAGNYVSINIGFELSDGFYTIIKTCFDEVTKNAVYAKFLQSPAIAGQNTAETRPGFQEGVFYPDVSMDTKYTKTTQKTTFGQILGSATLGTTYIKDVDYYLARGHLAARSDFVYATQQRATFWYVNTAPQWQTVNGGNWNTLEDNIRKFVAAKGRQVVMYVGTHGVATLPNASGQEQPLYLAYDPTGAVVPKVKVPEVFWKVVYDPTAKKAIAFVATNNPHKSTFTKMCTDVCSQLTWLTWQPTNQKLGFSYCCELNNLRTKIPTIPALDVTGGLLV